MTNALASSGRVEGIKDGGKGRRQKHATYAPRIRRGQKIDEMQALTDELSVQQIDSPFQLQEYLALLVRQNPHDVARMIALPLNSAAPSEAFVGSSNGPTSNGKGKEKDESEGGVFMGDGEDGLTGLSPDEEPHVVDTDVWIYEHLRRIVADLTTPWLTTLQRECDRKQRPQTCEAMNADDWMYLCASHGEEKQCCAIDYIIHTLDGTTALLNSHRHFPSRTYIPSTSLRHFGSISRRLSRIFVHAYEHHRDVFEACEAETSLYRRFISLVRFYDLIAVDSLPQVGVLDKDGSAAKGKGQIDGRTVVKDVDGGKRESSVSAATVTDEAADVSGDFAGRGAPKAGRQLFDHGGSSPGAPNDAAEDAEGEEEDDENVDPDDFEEDDDGRTPSRLHRSDSNASRITAIHVRTEHQGEEENAMD